jgi:lysophospholipase L1-like esterase
MKLAVILMTAASSLASVIVAPPSSAHQSAPSVAVIGDSLVHRSRAQTLAQLEAAGYHVAALHARGGWAIRQQQPNALEIVTNDSIDTLVVVLGTNDAGHHVRTRLQMIRDMRRFLAAVSPHVACIRWLNIKGSRHPPTRQYNVLAPIFNRVVQQVADEPSNGKTEVVDYNRAMGRRDDYFDPDNLHPNPLGQAAFAEVVTSAVGTCHPVPTGQRFWDVDPNSAMLGAAEWLGRTGVSTGFRNHTLGADEPVSRATAITWLWRTAGSPARPATHHFLDAPPGSVLSRALSWAHGRGIIEARSYFTPRRAISRAGAAIWLWHAAGAPTDAPDHGFADVRAGAGYAPALNWAKFRGIVAGDENNLFFPEHPASRGDFTTFLWRNAGAPT